MINNRKKRYLALATSLTLGLSLITQGPVTQVQALGRFFQQEGDRLSDEDIQMIQDIYATIQSQYIEDVDKDVLLDGALKGMVEALGDPHSAYLNSSETTDLDDSIEGSFQGIGVSFVQENGEAVIMSAIEGTPAADMGLLPYDVIVEADGQELYQMDTNEIVNLIRGPEGTTVDLKIRRGATEFDVTIERAEIPIISVEGEIDTNEATVGHVKISQFNSTTYDELVAIIEDLRNQGAEQFIIDLRFNPGGFLDQALSIANIFLDEGQTIMSMESQESSTTSVASNQLGIFKVEEPFVVLINEGSASASEILAAAIQENDQGPVVGMTTFGKGSVQSIYNETEFGELKLTFSRWLTPDNNWIHEEGVQPDIEIEPSELSRAVLLSNEEVLQMGDSSEFVKSLDLGLQALGYEIDYVGYFDETTEAAVKAFQADQGLEVTGTVTGDTANKFNQTLREYLKDYDSQYDQAVQELIKYSGIGQLSDEQEESSQSESSQETVETTEIQTEEESTSSETSTTSTSED